MADILTPEAATRIEELVADLNERPVRALVDALAVPASQTPDEAARRKEMERME